MGTASRALQLFDLIQSHRVTAVIYVAAKLGLAELLRSGPQSLTQLAGKTGADRPSLERLLRALLTIGLCTHSDETGYSTEIGAARQHGRTFLQGWAIFGRRCSPKHGQDAQSIMTGKTAAEL